MLLLFGFANCVFHILQEVGAERKASKARQPYKLRVMLRRNVKQGPRVLAYACVMYKMNQGYYQMHRKSTNVRHPWRLTDPASFCLL